MLGGDVEMGGGSEDLPRRQLDFGEGASADSPRGRRGTAKAVVGADAPAARTPVKVERDSDEQIANGDGDVRAKLAAVEAEVRRGEIDERACIQRKKELLVPHADAEFARRMEALDDNLARGVITSRAYATASRVFIADAEAALSSSPAVPSGANERKRTVENEPTGENGAACDHEPKRVRRGDPNIVTVTVGDITCTVNFNVPANKRPRSEGSNGHGADESASPPGDDNRPKRARTVADLVQQRALAKEESASDDGAGPSNVDGECEMAWGGDADDANGDTGANDDTEGGRVHRGNRGDAAGVPRARAPRTKRCPDCRQSLSDGSIRNFPGMGHDAVRDEEIALTDARLQLDGAGDGDITEKPVHRLADYAVFDSSGHMVAVDTGLIESGAQLYASGYIKFLTNDTPGAADGVPIDSMGPLTEWYVLGFDGGANAVLGVSTPCAEYLLTNPHPAYAPIIDPLRERMFLSKVVIEFAEDNPEGSFEELLATIQSTPAPNSTLFTEDSLLRHAQFVTDRIVSYDECADSDDVQLVTTPAIRTLIEYAGVTLGMRRRWLRGDRAPRRESKPKKKGDMMATSTPLVRRAFDAFFHAQIEEKDGVYRSRKNRCGVCDVCQSPDCGECENCRDMPKFGGTGIKKQACRRRKCPNMAVRDAAEAEADVAEDESKDESAVASAAGTPRKTAPRPGQVPAVVSWAGAPLMVEADRTYYASAVVDGTTVSVGSYVSILPTDPKQPLWIAQVVSLFGDARGAMSFHGRWLKRGNDTVLGETAHENEVFLETACDENPLDAIIGVVSVTLVPPSSAWATEGGTEAAIAAREREEAEGRDGKTYFCHKMYEGRSGRFVDIPPEALAPCPQAAVPIGSRACWACAARVKKEEHETHVFTETTDYEGKSVAGWRHRGVEYRPGDYVYIAANAIPSYAEQYEEARARRHTQDAPPAVDARLRDEVTYPELYRKRSQNIKGSNERAPLPYAVGRIVRVSKSRVTLLRMYRVEETPFEGMASIGARELFWGGEEVTVPVTSIAGRLAVAHVDDVPIPLETFLAEDHRFVFRHAYDGSDVPANPPPMSRDGSGLRCLYDAPAGGKGKGAAGKGKASVADATPSASMPSGAQQRPLRTLDIFAGCGGLSEGLHQSGACATEWAIEFEEVAAKAYRLNNPDAAVFTDDCNVLLRRIIDGVPTDPTGHRLPLKGEVECLVGGPPCQGYSGMNRFNHGEYSKFKNSLVVTYLSYLDYYRPRYFLLENVRNFVSFKNSVVVKLVLRALVDMDYQCGFGVLQAGEFGVAQTRRRAFIWAAAPGEALPQYPVPTHAFPASGCSDTVLINSMRFTFRPENPLGAPLPPVTVRDILSDLPQVENGASVEEMPYESEPRSDFQRRIRSMRGTQTVLYDHVCKPMNPLVHARICHIPRAPGSDWRDLPNKEVRLSDGTVAPKLQYTHDDKRMGRTSKGGLRGVCICAETGKCDNDDRWKQVGTLIPWCLPHTGSRHNEWAGLYGRLEWDGHFSTTVTNPEPMGKQGRVLHPEQNRVVSVRECARSQGFPDHFRFFGTILEKHRQVGNAVPPPLARALGNELKKAMTAKGVSAAITVLA